MKIADELIVGVVVREHTVNGVPCKDYRDAQKVNHYHDSSLNRIITRH